MEKWESWKPKKIFSIQRHSGGFRRKFPRRLSMRNIRLRPPYTRKNKVKTWILFYMQHKKKFRDLEWDQHQSSEGQREKNKHEDMLDHQFGGDVGPRFLISFFLWNTSYLVILSIYSPSYPPYFDQKMHIHVFKLCFSIIRCFCKNWNLSAFFDSRTLGLELDIFIEGLGTKNKCTPIGIVKLSFNRPGQRWSNKTCF